MKVEVTVYVIPDQAAQDRHPNGRIEWSFANL